MDAEVLGVLRERAALHRALGEPVRLMIVAALVASDRTPSELRELTGLDWNLLGFHLGVLEDARVVQRRGSEGDRRRRYVRLEPSVVDRVQLSPSVPSVRAPLFVCTHNSARSQFAAGLWRERTGMEAWSAGSDPARAVHRMAVQVASVYGVDLTATTPQGYEDVTADPDVVVSVCDRALERGMPFDTPRLHWSVPDPVTGDRAAFERAFADIAERMSLLVQAAA